MKESPILFKGPLVRAILSGEKTVTRRPIIVPATGANGGALREIVPSLVANRGDLFDARYELDNPRCVRSPYGTAGDHLWVRETWREGREGSADTFLYRATYEGGVRLKWRPSIFMPRRASRITLRITDLRPERLHAVTDAEALLEGVKHYDPEHLWDVPEPPFTPREVFAHLWCRYNGDASWSANPWVWRIEFERVAEQRL